MVPMQRDQCQSSGYPVRLVQLCEVTELSYAIVPTMTEKITNEMLYDLLKSVQAQVALTREDMEFVKRRLSSVDSRGAILHADLTHQADRLDRLESRMGRVEQLLRPDVSGRAAHGEG